VRRGTAKIADQDCILLLPADTPYAMQELLDEIDWRATRHGPLRVELDRREWLVAAPGTQPISCAACNRPVRVGYATGTRPPVCRACARAELTSGRAWRPAAWRAAAS
jgi:hypothetical protein